MVYAIGTTMPYLLAIGTFTFIYMMVPNTRVRLGPALVGGIVGGLLWQVAGWGFAVFVASSTKYSAIYSGFALVILFMFWLYLSWLILLFGASVAFYQQHPESLVETGGEPRLSNRMRERLALAIMSLIAAHYVTGRPAWTLQQLCKALDVPMHSVQTILNAFQLGGLLIQSNDSSRGYLPARDLAPISVKQLLDIVRSAGEDGFLNPNRLPVSERVEQVLQRFEQSLDASLQTVSIVDLADEPAKNPPLPPELPGTPVRQSVTSRPHQRKSEVPTTLARPRCDRLVLPTPFRFSAVHAAGKRNAILFDGQQTDLRDDFHVGDLFRKQRQHMRCGTGYGQDSHA